MDTYSFIYGLETTIYIISIVSIVTVFLPVAQSAFLFRMHGWFAFMLLIASLAMGLFGVIFPVINVVPQLALINFDILKEGFGRGYFQLMITGLLIGFNQIIIFIRVMLVFPIYILNEKLEISDSDKENLSNFHEIINTTKYPFFDEKRLKKINFVFNLKCLVQFSIFSFGIILIYTIVALGDFDETPFGLSVLIWAIFFFADDWVIISNYTLRHEIQPFKLDFIRIKIANIILFVGILFSLWTETKITLAILGTLLLTLLFYLRYLCNFDRRLFHWAYMWWPNKGK